MANQAQQTWESALQRYENKPNLNQGNIQGTMSGTNVNTQPQPTQAPQTQQVPQSGQMPQQQQQPAGMGGFMQNFAFGMIMEQIKNKTQENNALVKNKQLAVTALFDRPLMPDELEELSPAMRTAIESGDKRRIEMAIRITNDTLSGRTASLDKSIDFLTNIYQTSMSALEDERNRAESILMSGLKEYGSSFLDIYGPEQLQQIQNMGYNLEGIMGLPTKESPENINDTLFSVGLPYTIVSNKGKLTDSHLNKLQKVGIPPQDAQEIMNEILSGKSLDEIREWMRSLGVDPKILDDFMTALQGEEGEIETPEF